MSKDDNEKSEILNYVVEMSSGSTYLNIFGTYITHEDEVFVPKLDIPDPLEELDKVVYLPFIYRNHKVIIYDPT